MKALHILIIKILILGYKSEIIDEGKCDSCKKLYIAGLFPMSDDDHTYNRRSGGGHAQIGQGVLPAVILALRHINDDRSILTGYKLIMEWRDTKVSCFIYSCTDGGFRYSFRRI